MLQELSLTNFKSFSEAQTIPFAPVTIFVGANGSGKSNAFDAIRFLQGVGKRMRIDDILRGRKSGGFVVHPGIRGGVNETCWSETTHFSIETRASLRIPATENSDGINGRLQETECTIRHRMRVDTDQFPAVDDEILDLEKPDEQRIISDLPLVPPDLSMAGRWTTRNGRMQSDASRLGLALQLNHSFGGRNIVAAYLSALAELQFIDLRPAYMRGYVASSKSVGGFTFEMQRGGLWRGLPPGSDRRAVCVVDY